MTVDPLDVVKSQLRKYEVRFFLEPERWLACAHGFKLIWHFVRFENASAASIPNDKHGVYFFAIRPDIPQHPLSHYVMYVGKADDMNFRARFKGYLTEKADPDGRPRMKDLLTLWEKHLWFCYAEVPNKSDIEPTEDVLIEAYVPPVNRRFKGLLSTAISAFMS